jgi:hypothetical protein
MEGGSFSCLFSAYEILNISPMMLTLIIFINKHIYIYHTKGIHREKSNDIDFPTYLVKFYNV